MTALKTIPYSQYITELPPRGKFIIAQQPSPETIIVYQAFNPDIAGYAVAHQRFGGEHYNADRMTWIKPGFLWMMYRSGWAQKENQERILALTISFEGFCSLLQESVLSSYDRKYNSKADWQRALKFSEVRLQWDPDHSPEGTPLTRKAVQIGIRGEALNRLNNEYLQSIEDITPFVHEQYQRLRTAPEQLRVMEETIVGIGADLQDRLSLTVTAT
jgi:hypothetical protein